MNYSEYICIAKFLHAHLSFLMRVYDYILLTTQILYSYIDISTEARSFLTT